jgi:hypothetical protein
MTKARDLANGGFGLVLVKPSSVVNGTDNGKGTVSFSAQSSVSLNDVFNSTYTNYRIVMNLSGSGDLTLRVRASGTDAATGYEGNNIRMIYNSTTITGQAETGGGSTSLLLGQLETVQNWGFFVDVSNPFNGIKTSFVWNASSAGYFYSGAKWHNTQSPYTGFTIFGTSMGGTISVYGYNK